jgi:arginyl-tRNA synthetase
MEEMIETARTMSEELGKLDNLSKSEVEEVTRMIGLGALKYFILKVDPKKNMLFDPKESIDFNGNTGPFIQYTHARIRSILRKAAEEGIGYKSAPVPVGSMLADKEVELIQLINDFESTVMEAATSMSPAMIANYCYELAKLFNQYYHDFPMLREENVVERNKRITISEEVAVILKRGMGLLGIGVPERM